LFVLFFSLCTLFTTWSLVKLLFNSSMCLMLRLLALSSNVMHNDYNLLKTCCVQIPTTQPHEVYPRVFVMFIWWNPISFVCKSVLKFDLPIAWNQFQLSIGHTINHCGYLLVILFLVSMGSLNQT
jgi:hypothetical protein